MNSAAHSPASALVAHVENLVHGGRVLVIGHANHLLADHLLERGARLVQVLDSDARRVSHSAAHNSERRISYAQLTEGSLRDASFDCAIVENLSAADNPAALLRGVRQSLGTQGLAFVATANATGSSTLLGSRPGKLSFDELDELTGEAFDATLLLGQSPFIGYSVVSLELDGPPEPSLDNGFLAGGADQADYYIAVCGSDEAIDGLSLEDMTIVQLPAGRMLDDGAGAKERQERRATKRAQDLEAELKTLRQSSSTVEVDQLTRELEERDSWIRELEARAESADARADDAEAETERLARQLEHVSVDPEEMRRLSESLDDAERETERAQKDKQRAERQRAEVEKRIESAEKRAADAGRRIADADQRLADADERVANTEQRATDAEKRLAEVEAKLREARSRAADAQADTHEEHTAEREGFRQKCSELTKKLKTRESELSKLHKLADEQEAEIEESHEVLIVALKKLADAQKRADKSAKVAAKEARAAAKKECKDEHTVSKKEAKARARADQAAAAEVTKLEEQLEERATHIAVLEEQLRKLEAYGRSLAAELKVEEIGAATSNEAEAQVDELERTLAEREADLVAAEWKIGELKQRLQNLVG